ncbi:MAG: flagellar hook-basal body complex protein [Proteobacteria bacterium]|nr:flagellar hook-basal body complex protein [Pseudomonadota bacterium]
MSIFGAMFSGVTGLNAQSQALGMIADNIANVNTIGYKGTTAHFFSLVTQAASRTTYTPGGVAAAPSQGIDRQGLLQASVSETDIAIAGRGFFVVSQSTTAGSGQFLFTRAGSFEPDQNGNLVNTAGYFLQGWPLTDGTTLPTNTSTLSSVTTVNVANLAGTATPTSTVNLSLNLPSTAPAAAGGGQINTSISTPLAGITDIDYKTFGTLNDVARLDYVATGSTMTIDIGGQTGTFDLSNRLPGIYKSTGTLAGMEITLASSFDFTTNISSTTQTNTVAETNRIGAEPSNFSLATDLTGITSISLNASANDNILTIDYDKSTGVLTITDATASQSGTVTIGTTGGTGTKDYTVASGALAGTIVTIDTSTFDYATSFNNTTNANGATKTGGSSSVTLTSAATTIAGPALRQLNLTTATNFVMTILSNAGADTVTHTGPSGWTSAITGGDLTTAGTTGVTVTFTKGGESFTALVITSGNVLATEDIVVTLPLTELENKIAADSDDLVVTTATAPTLTNWDAGDLAALSSTVFNFNVDANGRVLVASGPTGFTVDQTATQALNATGTRNIVVTDGTNTFTITLAVGTAITKGSADLTVDLLEAVNSFGLGTAPGGGRFSATMQIFDSLGNAHDLIIDFDKTATNQWQILVNDPVLASTGAKSGTVAAASRSITFNGDGTPASITFPAIAISAWTTGANDSSVAINLGTVNTAAGVTQFAGDFALSSIDQNGVTFGGFVGVNIADDGKVTAVFDNGEQLAIYQLPLALFANPNGLDAVTGNAFRQTDKSGDILLQQANSGGSGSVASSALESSTVDLAEEFIKMITTQRAYSAAAKIITTADEMLEELIRMRR